VYDKINNLDLYIYIYIYKIMKVYTSKTLLNENRVIMINIHKNRVH